MRNTSHIPILSYLIVSHAHLITSYSYLGVDPSIFFFGIPKGLMQAPGANPDTSFNSLYEILAHGPRYKVGDLIESFNTLYEIRIISKESLKKSRKNLSILSMRFLVNASRLGVGSANFQYSLWDSYFHVVSVAGRGSLSILSMRFYSILQGHGGVFPTSFNTLYEIRVLVVAPFIGPCLVFQYSLWDSLPKCQHGWLIILR